MAITTAQEFRLTETAQADGWGTDVNQLRTISVGNNNTVAAHPSAAGTTSITLDPNSTRSAQNLVTDDYGWAWNSQAADDASMGSTDTAKRRVPPGQWRMVHTATLPSPATLGSLALRNRYYVYRVGPAPAYTRTLLFSWLSNTANGPVLGGAVDFDSLSSSQPEVLLEEDETIMVGVYSILEQSSGVLGATVAGNATYRMSSGTEPWQLIVPPPGIETVAPTQGSGAGSAAANALAASAKGTRGASQGATVAAGGLQATAGLVGSAAGTSTPQGALAGAAGIVGAGSGSAVAQGVLAGAAAMVGGSAGSSAAAGVLAGAAGLVGSSAGDSDAGGALAGTGGLAGVAQGASDASGRVGAVAGMVGAAAGDAQVLAQLAALRGTVGTSLVGEGGGEVELPPGILRLRPDGRYEALMNGQTLPPGAVRLTTV